MSHSLPPLCGRSVRRVHCVGAGGMGLGPLAIFLSGLGFEVSGEDDAMSEAMRVQLLRAGVRVGPLDAACECLVVSSAIAPSHPAAQAAQRLGIPTARRGEVLADAVAGRRLVAVCGSHGKTTTTAMLVEVLRRSGFDAAYVLGGLFGDEAIAPASAGSLDWVVAEVDESDGTIRRFNPEITVLVNFDWDHPDQYKTREDIEETFRALLRRTRGAVLYNAHCADSCRLSEAALLRQDFGAAGSASHFTFEPQSEDAEGMTLMLGGDLSPGPRRVRAFGAFNRLNATAALAAAHLMGAQPPADALALYPTVRRRQSSVPSDEAFCIVEDYAHHPAEIRALLESLRVRAGSGRLVVAFQSHRFSRTAQFRADFAAALSLADKVDLLETYPAGEAPLPGGSAYDLYQVFGDKSRVNFHGENASACFDAATAGLGSGDLLAVVGAGDIDRSLRFWLDGRRWDRWVTALRPRLPSGERLQREESLAQKTTLRVGGAARVYAEPSSPDSLATLLRQAQADRVPVYPLGRGSNLLVPDCGVDGLVISLVHPHWASYELLPGDRLRVGAGLRLKNLCGLAVRDGFSGFEFLEGIPGNVGGSLRMNAGAMGGWLFDVVETVELMRPDGIVQVLDKACLDVDYRQCRGLERAIALSAVLRIPSHEESAAIQERIDAYRRKRQSSQPREPSAGCIFKNPPGDSAGRLIDQCGLKGERHGDALVSPVHANFIVNTGSASASDVIALVRRVRARVREMRGIDLEPEVQLFGRNWSEML